MEIANASKKKKRRAVLHLFSAPFINTPLCLTTAGCFQNKTYQYVFALFITLKIKETKKGTSSLYKPYRAEFL